MVWARLPPALARSPPAPARARVVLISISRGSHTVFQYIPRRRARGRRVGSCGHLDTVARYPSQTEKTQPRALTRHNGRGSPRMANKFGQGWWVGSAGAASANFQLAVPGRSPPSSRKTAEKRPKPKKAHGAISSAAHTILRYSNRSLDS